MHGHSLFSAGLIMIPNQLSTEKVGQIPIVQLENANNMDGHDQRGAPVSLLSPNPFFKFHFSDPSCSETAQQTLLDSIEKSNFYNCNNHGYFRK